MISYENFDLRIRSDGERFVVSAQRGTQVASEPFLFDSTVSWALPDLERAGETVTAQRGAALFAALIHGRVRDLYQQGRGQAQGGSDAGLRLRLIFDPRDERLRPVIRLPWELLRDGAADANELPALDSGRPVVRIIETVEHLLARVDGPLERVLLVLANPGGSTPLDLGREQRAVEAALGRITIRPDVLPDATRYGLYEKVTDTDPQIVHYMGHSDLDPATGEGVLVLQDEHGREDRLTAREFARFFTGKNAPRLVILNSCLSAVQGGQQPFAGIAFALVAAGLPAVIAMQSEIRDSSAIRFTERLYRRFAAGDPIEVAVADARKALSISRLRTLDWAAPVLFTRAQPSVVVPPTPQPQVPSAAAQVADTSSRLLFANTTHGSVGTQVNANHIDTFVQGKNDA